MSGRQPSASQEVGWNPLHWVLGCIVCGFSLLGVVPGSALATSPFAVPFAAGASSDPQTGGLVFAGLLLNGLIAAVLLTMWVRPKLRSLSRSVRGPQEQSPQTTAKVDRMDDRDVVCQLLEQHGGQIRQSKIVEETDWSKAKVSRLLCEMEEDGSIVKIQLGRQNLVCLDGSEPELSKPMPPSPEGGRSVTRPERRSDDN